MKYSLYLFSNSLFASTVMAQDTIWAVYMFHRHGDRTAKALPPTSLTVLGYDEVISSGAYYNTRYVSGTSTLQIQGISNPAVKNAQLAVTAPTDTVLQSSAEAFLQGLYPPQGAVGQKLANGTTVTAPLDGYQLIPVGLVSAGSGSESSAWLQDSSGCANAIVSSNNYFSSTEFSQLNTSTADFYQRLDPVVAPTFAAPYMTYKNAYSIFDLINVARIHNATIPSGTLLDDPTVLELQVNANIHEWGLAYNASDNARAVPGMQLAGEMLQFFNTSITGKGASKMGVQFGAYGTMLSLFGLLDLQAANPNFMGIPDYASSMVFELFTNASSTTYPDPSLMQVRFLYSNQSTGILGAPTQFPMFGGQAMSLTWDDFSSKVGNFAIETTEQWCVTCGNTTGTCAPFASQVTGNTSSTSSGTSSGGDSGMSNAVAGVIGAMVTLAVILGLEALAALIFGLRVVRKGAVPSSPALKA